MEASRTGGLNTGQGRQVHGVRRLCLNKDIGMSKPEYTRIFNSRRIRTWLLNILDREGP